MTVTPRALCKAGEHLGLVEFVPSGTLVREKEVALKAGITLKLACKPKLGKVYPCSYVGGGEHKDLKRTHAEHRV